MDELTLYLQDEEWTFEYSDHDREIGRLVANRELPIFRQAKKILDGGL